MGELGVVLHEVGVHAGLEGLLGKKLYAEVLGQIKNPTGALASAVAAARARVPHDTRAAHVTEETLAYLIEDTANHGLPLVRRILEAIRACLLRQGFQLKEIRPEDLVAMARASVFAVSREVTVQRGVAAAYSQKALPDEVPVVSLTGAFTVKPEALWRTANEYYRDNLQGRREPNAWLGGEVVFSGEGRKEAFSIGRRNVLRMSVVKALRELARQAVPIESMLDERGMTDIKGITHVVASLYAPCG